MDATRISIERVLELDVPVIWREAAAVVCEAVSAVRRAGGFSDERPRASSCLVTRGGEVVLADGMARTRPETLVVLASHLLETCAEPDRFGAALRSGTFLEFVDDFASRTSPNQRRVAIASLALRALAAEADLSLARSTDSDDPAVDGGRVVNPVEAGGLLQPAPSKPLVRRIGTSAPALRAPAARRSRAWLRVAVVTALALGIAAGTWSWPLVTAGPMMPPALPDVSSPPPGQSALQAPGGDAMSSPLALPPVEITIVDNGAEAPSNVLPQAAALETVAPATTATPRVPVMPVRPDPALPLNEATLDDPIFSSDSGEVEPPVLVSKAEARVVNTSGGSSRPFLEVLIDRFGHVEHVQLLGGSAGLSGRQQALLDAARRWQFVPAHRDGQPVRYNARLAVAF